MATAGVLSARARWAPLDRILIVVLLIVFSLGTPGLGIETRHVSDDAIAAAIYSLMLALPIAALVLSWKWPRPAARLGVIGSVPLVAAAVLDLSGVLIGPPPAGMIAVDGGFAILSLAVIWRCWRLTRG